jgi:DHA2 family multidrug resistance protein
MLDEGKNLDWFSSPIIIGLAAVAVVGFCAFLIWEFTEEHPIVDLRVFRHRGFTAAVLTISLTFAGFFAANVLTPLWLQSFMAYTATDAGMTTAWIGITAFVVAPAVAAMSMKFDPRKLVFFGIIWLGVITLYRTVATTEMTYWDVSLPLMLLGLGMPFFFIPSTAAALGSVEEEETNSAAGLMNFMRTLSGAIATSMVTTYWEDEITRNRADLVGIIDPGQAIANQLSSQGMNDAQVLAVLEHMVTEQSVMLATNELMLVTAYILIAAAFLIWLVPKPGRAIDTSAIH